MVFAQLRASALLYSTGNTKTGQNAKTADAMALAYVAAPVQPLEWHDAAFLPQGMLRFTTQQQGFHEELSLSTVTVGWLCHCFCSDCCPQNPPAEFSSRLLGGDHWPAS